MAAYATGDMWDIFESTDHFIITTNAVVKRNGALVMGAGIAKQARDRFPGIDKEFGEAVKMSTNDKGHYGTVIGKHWGMFQVKTHFKNRADLMLIVNSAKDLYQHAASNPNEQFDLNFPGIGNGGLACGDVYPIVSQLPDNVRIWTYGETP